MLAHAWQDSGDLTVMLVRLRSSSRCLNVGRGERFSVNRLLVVLSFAVFGALGCGEQRKPALKQLSPSVVWTRGEFQQADEGRADMGERNREFPATYIDRIAVTLRPTGSGLELRWAGPLRHEQEIGPFKVSPGRGDGRDCNLVEESRTKDSLCTPKGVFRVLAFSDQLESYRFCEHVTWFDLDRELAIHSHPSVPDEPVSSGCLRVSSHAAQLIHNNSLSGVTEVAIDGQWSRPVSAEELVVSTP